MCPTAPPGTCTKWCEVKLTHPQEDYLGASHSQGMRKGCSALFSTLSAPRAAPGATSSLQVSSSLQKAEAVFCTKVSRINNKRCAELLENFSGRQQGGEQGAARTMGLPWQPLPAAQLCTLGLSGWVVPTQHKTMEPCNHEASLHSRH